MRTLVWFRGKDLRVADHRPLDEAAQKGEVVPVFVLDPYFFEPGRARKLPNRMAFLLDSLRELETNLAMRGARLWVVPGKSVEVVPKLADQIRADQVYAHRWTEPFGRERDRRVQARLGSKFVLFEGETLLTPGTLRTGSGHPYAVYSQFARAFLDRARVETPVGAPERIRTADVSIPSVPIPTLQDLGIAPNASIHRGGESQAHARLGAFLDKAASEYDTLRDRMDLEGTSRLSADLKFGTISIRTVWNAIARAVGETTAGQSFLRELLWREFSHSTLWDRPELLERPFRPGFEGFPWTFRDDFWEAWVRGRTGYPVVDAAARQLLAEGFVHNRARMISASFLTKHLLISYQRGESHYLEHLTDGDWAQNNAGWQWSAGCGCDAQPYFRIFNPMTQGEKFDPDGSYVRRWVPELAKLPSKLIHQPWEGAPLELAAAGVRLGSNYPNPVVDHRAARDRFLALANGHLKNRQIS